MTPKRNKEIHHGNLSRQSRKTYYYERFDSYIWSPKLNKAGRRNTGYELMKQVKKVITFFITRVVFFAISIAQESCQSKQQPKELKTVVDVDWDDDGWDDPHEI